MEFSEKLQQLRKQKELTQEQLAEKLYVSRAAVSKWESGRGWPNLDSLKDIAEFFGISLDELLSSKELLDVARAEKKQALGRLSGLTFATLDVLTVAFLFLPLFGQREGEGIRAVTLWRYTDVSAGLRIAYFAVLLLLPLWGVGQFLLRKREKAPWIGKLLSLALSAGAILLFAISRQPYVTALLFLLFLLKIVLLIQEKHP